MSRRDGDRVQQKIKKAEKDAAFATLGRLTEAAPADDHDPYVLRDPKVLKREAAQQAEARARAARHAGDGAPAATDRKRKGRKRKSGKDRRRKDAAPAPAAKPTERELLTALMEAKTDDEICEAVAKWCWITIHDGDEQYANRIPSWRELIVWWNRDHSALVKQTERALSDALGTPAFWTSRLTAGALAEDARAVAYEAREILTLGEVHQRWVAANPLPHHPLVPMIETWQQLAPETKRIADKSVLIMSRSVAQVEPTAENYYLSRFQPLIHRESTGQLIMDLTTDEELGPTLPANIWTMGLASAEKRGAVIPLALRIWVAAILHTPLSSRHGRYPVELADLTLRKFLAWVYTSKKVPKPVRYWPRLMAAREVINATELPFEWRGNLWARPVVTLATPLTRPGLDDPWPVTVHLPPGNGTGPAIRFPRLQYWSVRNAACYRALINLAYRWHIEGKRMMPAARGRHWLQIRDPKRYDRITDTTADALCYPPGTGAKRRDQRIADAYTALDELVKEGDAVTVDGRLLPPPR